MARSKLRKFNSIKEFENVLEVNLDNLSKIAKILRQITKSRHVILELGCGYGEYTIANALLSPESICIGIDIKGDRLYKGAMEAKEQGLGNVYFVRSQIQHVDSLFVAGSVDTIWLPFSDPQMKSPKNRLVGSAYVARYSKIFRVGGEVIIKTDSIVNWETAHSAFNGEAWKLVESYADLYNEYVSNPLYSVNSRYEQMYTAQGKKIMLLRYIKQ